MNKIVKKIGNNYFYFENGLPKLKLNETSVFILERKLKGVSVEDIAMELTTEYDVKYEEALNDISNFIFINKL